MPYILKDKVQLYYEYESAHTPTEHTETIVLVHGIGFDLRGWDLIVPYITRDYHVLRYDFRGHGSSDRGEETLADTVMVDDLNYILDYFQINSFHIVAHGAGSIIALYYTAANPGRVQSNALLSLPLFISMDTASKYTSYRKALIGNSMYALADHVIPNVTLLARDTPEINKLYEAFAKVTMEVYFEVLEFFLNAHSEIFEMFKKNTVPTLMLTGEQDPIYPPYLSGLIASSSPGCRYMIIYNSSNMVFYDQPEETYNQIKRFFENRPAKKTSIDPLLQNLHSDFLNLVDNNAAPAVQPAATRLSIKLINQFQVQLDGDPILGGWGRRNAKELLTYLLLNPSVDRDRLCADLWPDMDITKARGLLRVCLAHLKQLLQNDQTRVLHIDKKQISLSSAVDCDLTDLLETIKWASVQQELSYKENIIQELFQNVDGNSFRNLDRDWNMTLRIRTEIQLIDIAHKMAAHLLAQHKPLEAIAYLKHVILLNPEEHQTYEQIARLYEQCGNGTEAQKWRARAAHEVAEPRSTYTTE
ncbi:alpha/beta hydrolase [Paenibacillus donghaensis]|uniref:AB hydrolase-1 domain-containing protein n=1 Tax=Paenibacillus donghaensis TaxID=414771 RepID=A0A2Z2KIQ5_9BACL|nr:alpha/beta hydrolase [Paenibacillus donghaensis]ASA22149.1 hypothetical protein B9T62_15995 [Paenibacillus donghaensis]